MTNDTKCATCGQVDVAKTPWLKYTALTIGVAFGMSNIAMSDPHWRVQSMIANGFYLLITLASLVF